MIKANQLRIGNFILYGDEIHKVSEISIAGHAVLSGVFHCNLDKGYTEPIPLDDSWMLQFGFQLFPWGWVKKSTDDVGLRITHHFYFERSGEKALKIEYVHELQNLWFVHTKEELSFSP